MLHLVGLLEYINDAPSYEGKIHFGGLLINATRFQLHIALLLALSDHRFNINVPAAHICFPKQKLVS